MNEQLREACYHYLDDLARAGVVDHALDNAILEGTTVEEHVVEVLHAAGRLPEGRDREQRDDVTDEGDSGQLTTSVRREGS
jgi:hypothetical protein